jgi:hypothetical protein
MSPLSSYLPQLERDPTQTPETSITSVSHTLALETTPFDTSRAPGASPSAALEPAQAIYTESKTESMAETSNQSACNDEPGTDKLAKIEAAVELIETAPETSSRTEMSSTKMELDSP